MASTDRKELFDFMLTRVRDVANTTFLDEPRAFSKWFLTLYFDLGPDAEVKIPDGAGDGKVDAFFRNVDDKTVTHVLVNSKFTEKFDQIAPPKFYDEIVRFRRGFEDTDSREAYLETVRPSLRAQYGAFFEQFDEGNAELVFVTNHKINSRQAETIQNVGVTVLHLDDLVQCMVDNIEGAMPRTNSLTLTDIGQVLTPPRVETGIATSLVFAKLVDFIEYMKDDPHELLFSRNVRLDLSGTEVNKDIAETFALHPDEFAYSNNGITMLCEKHTHEMSTAKLVITNPRVVNGAQTLHSVRRAKKKPASARVMVKIIELAPPRPAHFREDVTRRKEVVNKIAVRTNRQNTIQKADLVANDEKQHDLANFFRRHNLYYERRRKEWNVRKLGLLSVGISKGPTLKSMMQLGAAYCWQSIGPAKARSSVNSLFEEDNYSMITSLSPQVFYRIYLLQNCLLESAVRVASKTSARNRDLRKYVGFAMFSLFVKSLQQVKLEIATEDEIAFLGEEKKTSWDVLVKFLFKFIDGHLRRKAREERSKGSLTIINYSKNATYMSDLLNAKLSTDIISATRKLIR